MIQGINLRDLVDLGVVEINLYGILYASAFLSGFFLVRRFLIAQGKDKNLAFTAMIYIIAGTLLGARLFYAFYYQFSSFINDPLMLLYFWEGGMSFHGGLLGGVIAGAIFCNKYKVDFLAGADYLAAYAAFFLGLGRVVNFLDAELYGKISEAMWCVQFPDVTGCRHPVQLYDAVKNFAIFFILLSIRRRNFKKGFIFLSFVFLYSFFRFFIDFFREYEAVYFGLGSGQYLDLLAFIFSGYLLKLSFMNRAASTSNIKI